MHFPLRARARATHGRLVVVGAAEAASGASWRVRRASAAGSVWRIVARAACECGGQRVAHCGACGVRAAQASVEGSTTSYANSRTPPLSSLQIKKNYVDVPTSTLGRVAEGKQDIERIGVGGGKPPALPLDISVALIEGMVAANDAGTRRYDKGDLKHQGRRMAESLGRETTCQFSSGWFAATKHKLKDATGQSLRTVMPRAKTKAKADSSHPATVAAYLLDVGNLFKRFDQPGAPLGKPVMRSSCICFWDEVAFVCRADGTIRRVLTINGRPERVAMNEGDYHFTVFVGVCSNGIALPPFLVYDGKLWQACTDGSEGTKLQGVPSEWSATWTDTGSMKKSTGYSEEAGESGDHCEGEACFVGTMVEWAHHCVRVVRDVLQHEWDIIHFIDGASCHKDDIAAKILADDRQWVYFIPAETSHFLQVGDHEKLNGKLQKMKRALVDGCANYGMRVTKRTIARVLLSVYYAACCAPNIIAAVKGVGFTYLSGTAELGEEHLYLILDEKAINSAIALHVDAYKMNREYQELGMAVGPHSLRNRRQMKIAKVNDALTAVGLAAFPPGMTEAGIEVIQDVTARAHRFQNPHHVKAPTLMQLNLTEKECQVRRRGAKLMNSKEEIELLRRCRKRKAALLVDKAKKRDEKAAAAELKKTAATEAAALKVLKTERKEALEAWLSTKGWALKGGNGQRGGPITLKSLTSYLVDGDKAIEWAQQLVTARRDPEGAAAAEEEAAEEMEVEAEVAAEVAAEAAVAAAGGTEEEGEEEAGLQAVGGDGGGEGGEGGEGEAGATAPGRKRRRCR